MIDSNPVPQASRALFLPVTIFLSAFLLFQVQPIMGRFVLPWFGGGPAVWTNCLLFFQTILLAGYAYAHWLGSRRSGKLQAGIHTALLAASFLFLPIGPHAADWKPASSYDPSGRILWLLTATCGGPYLVLSATTPLLQRWFTRSEPSRAPWRLYALSNLGSFLALLSYPFIIEPYVRLRVQTWIWSGLYVGFGALCGLTAWHQRPVSEPAATVPAERPSIWTILFWLGLSACTSTLLLATTNQISQEIAVNPFLWVAPLSVYLLTFVLTFEKERWYHRVSFAVSAGVLAPVGCALLAAAIAMPLGLQLAAYLIVLFAVCMLCHGELARSKPPAQFLTMFYLTIAAGGALGGVFVALIAPRVFTEFLEYPIGLAAACLLGFLGWLRTGAMSEWTSGNIGVRIPLMALLLGCFTSIWATINSNQPAKASLRNFYGILRVVERFDDNGARRELRHGRILHGFQYLEQDQQSWGTTYYGPHSGAALALNAWDRPNRRIAIVGLGAGTMAVWGRPGDILRFYEINPDVVALARSWFTFLKDTKARTEIVLGDARVQLERELAAGRSEDFDIIAVDAFSGDTIPIHLLTAECGEIYRRHLRPGGLLLLHVSNLMLRLEPVAQGLAHHLQWQSSNIVSPANEDTGESSADWVVITGNSEFLENSGLAGLSIRWKKGREHPPITWTDDFASLWHVLR